MRVEPSLRRREGVSWAGSEEQQPSLNSSILYSVLGLQDLR